MSERLSDERVAAITELDSSYYEDRELLSDATDDLIYVQEGEALRLGDVRALAREVLEIRKAARRVRVLCHDLGYHASGCSVLDTALDGFGPTRLWEMPDPCPERYEWSEVTPQARPSHDPDLPEVIPADGSSERPLGSIVGHRKSPPSTVDYLKENWHGPVPERGPRFGEPLKKQRNTPRSTMGLLHRERSSDRVVVAFFVVVAVALFIVLGFGL